jgi:hypothetical protein
MTFTHSDATVFDVSVARGIEEEWAQPDSNRRPPVCETGVITARPWARFAGPEWYKGLYKANASDMLKWYAPNECHQSSGGPRPLGHFL